MNPSLYSSGLTGARELIKRGAFAWGRFGPASREGQHVVPVPAFALTGEPRRTRTRISFFPSPHFPFPPYIPVMQQGNDRHTGSESCWAESV